MWLSHKIVKTLDGMGLCLTCQVIRAPRGYAGSSQNVGSEPQGTLSLTVRAQVSYLADTETGRW